ncbi:MAG: outer membrane lipid asymmetry maintenance protein MlaD [Gammaproteobacteria bacterium]|nr:outer membrane lipid asymmetry maintenance protein MlaD [Gammaproteobacteria bacterium]
MKKANVELAVGLFLIGGFLCFSYISIKLGDISFFSDNTYTVEARFTSISGLKEGASIEIAGVKVGKVTNIQLDLEEYEAVVKMAINRGVKLQEDSIASIRTAGIIGDRYVAIAPGGEDTLIGDNGTIEETEAAINLEELVSKYIFESK